MHKQILTELESSLKRFIEAKDPRNIYASEKEITAIFNLCRLQDKDLLSEMTILFFKQVKENPQIKWENIRFMVVGRIIKCVDCYIFTKEEALDYLLEGGILRQVISHLMNKYAISFVELREARDKVAMAV
jgi:hypothetical protein